MDVNNLSNNNQTNVGNLSEITDRDFVIDLDGNIQQNNQSNFVDNKGYQSKIENEIADSKLFQDDDVDDDVSEDIEKDVKESVDKDLDKNKQNNLSEQDYSDYSPMSLTALALAEEGLNFFGDEVPKDLKAKDFVENFKKFTNEVISNQLNSLGETAKYIEYLIQTGGKIEELTPALELERYANYDLNNPELTEEQLEELVRAMYVRQVADPSLVDGLIEADRNKNQLYDKAVKAKEFLSNYRNQLIEEAKENHKQQQLLEQQRLQEESAAFAGALSKLDNIGGVKITDKERSELFDMLYKKNQLVTIQNPNTGQTEQHYLTEYELAIYNTVNNPVKLAKLLYFLKNDFDLSKIENQIQKKSNRNLLEMLDSGKNKVSNIPNVKLKDFPNEETVFNINL